MQQVFSVKRNVSINHLLLTSCTQHALINTPMIDYCVNEAYFIIVNLSFSNYNNMLLVFVLLEFVIGLSVL